MWNALTRKKILDTLFDTLKPALVPLGFKGRRVDAQFTRSTGPLVQAIGFGIELRVPTSKITMVNWIDPGLDPPWAAVAQGYGGSCFLVMDAVAARAGARPPGDRVSWMERQTPVCDSAQLQDAALDFLRFLREATLPLYDTILSLEQLDQEINRTDPALKVFMPGYVDLIVAAHFGRAQCEAAAARCAAASKEEWIRDKFLALRDELLRALPPG